MPLIAILSDIHGNLPALEAVLREVDQTPAEEIVFGGDIVGYGASPRQCVEFVKLLGGRCVIGNHEYYTKSIGEKGIENLSVGWEKNPVLAGVVHAFRTVPEEDLAWIQNLPWSLSLNEETLIAHAGLEAPEEWPYLSDLKSATPSLEILEERGLTLGFFGHTHRLGIYPERKGAEETYEIPKDSATAITVGSVGQSRDPFDNRAAWVLWDTEARTVEFRKVEYDWKRAAQQILDAGLPIQSAARLISLLDCEDSEL